MFARIVLFVLLLLLPIGMLVQGAAPPTGGRPRYKGPLGLAVEPRGRLAYVALHDADALAVVDLKDGKVLSEVPVGRKPYDVALVNGVAYVTCEADDTVTAVDVATRTIKRTFKVGQAPGGIAPDAGGKNLLVVCRDDRTLWTLNPLTGQSTKTPLPPQPEGNFVRASNLELVLDPNPAYRVAPRPFGLFTPGTQIANATPLPVDPARTAFNPTLDINYSFSNMDLVAHTRPRWFTPTVRADQGRIFTNALSFFMNRTAASVVLLDELETGYPDPSDVVVGLPKETMFKKNLPLNTDGVAANHPLKGSRVFISSGGADKVVVLDLNRAAQHAQANPSAMPGFGQFGGGGWTGGFGGPILGPIPGPIPAGPVLAVPGPPRGGQIGGGGFGHPGMGYMNIGGPMGWAGPMGGRQPGFGNLGGGHFNLGGGNLGTVPFGWNGGMAGFHENLAASHAYTLARLPTQANPRRLKLTPDGKTLVVSNYLGDSLTQIDTEKLRVLGHISLGGPAADAARRGEVLFHSAKHTFQQQFTCASCHPNGGSDGLAWDTSREGTGEHLNTRDLHGVRDTGPFGWRGESETLADRVRNTMREVHRHKISDANASDLAAYLETLEPRRPLPQPAYKPPPPPTDFVSLLFGRKKEPTPLERGRALFVGKGRCVHCHEGPSYSSEGRRAVIANHKNEMIPFDVPSLRGVGRTAPYLHDGRAQTLEQIFAVHNPRHRHGAAHLLTPAELHDVVTFLKSL
jgi:YVTN family beta-propeller protein